MKPKRVILCYDIEVNLPALRLLLTTHGYRVLSCTEPRELECRLSKRVDLIVTGHKVPFDPTCCSQPVLFREEYDSAANLLERIRIALIRKRAPKIAERRERLKVS